MMKNELLSKTLAEIVNENHQAASVFEKYGLDFCCRGKRSLQKACEENQLSEQTIVAEVEDAMNQQNSSLKEFDKLSLTELVDYIVSVHHVYTKRELQQISGYLQKLSSKHGERHKELYAVLESFMQLKDELELHMQKEELILFPGIKRLETGGLKEKNIQTPIDVMESDHEYAGNLLEKIRGYTNNYTLPEDACTTYRLSFVALQAFEKDLHQHIHLENNILFPKALELSDFYGAGSKNNVQYLQ